MGQLVNTFIERGPEADYTKYEQTHSYKHSTGTEVAASSNRSGAARLLRLHGPYSIRVVDFDMARAGCPPILPSAANIGGAETYYSGLVCAPLPTVNTRDGSYSYAMRGQYMYLSTAVRVPGTAPLPTGRYPFSVQPQDDEAARSLAALPGFDVDAPLATTEAQVSAALFDDAGPYRWPFTFFPAETFTTDLFQG